MSRATQAPIIAETPAGVNLTIDGAISSYRRHLRAENKSPATLTAYLGALERFNRFVKAQGMPTELVAIRREHLEAFLVDLTERGSSPASVNFYYRSLQPFFRWAVSEDELRESPMARMRPPRVPESPRRCCARKIWSSYSRPATGRASRIAATPPCCGCCSIPACAGAN